MSSQMPPYLGYFELRASSDSAKTDLELVCTECDQHLCDAEAGDNLEVLGNVAESHARDAGHWPL